MSFRLRRTVPALLALSSALLEVSPAVAATWQTNVNYGASTRMDLYVPDAPASPAPVVVTLHYCSGMASNARWLQSYADMHGFILITPQAGGECFDANPARSGERANIVAMVEYVVETHGGDATRVFATGASSGACMTQALLAAYPEVFAGGSSLAGVPAGAWTGGNSYGWSTSGTSGGEAWGNKVRQASPDFTGQRPRIQLWHGQGDTTLTYSQSYPAQVAQWTNVFGVDEGDATMENIKPPGAQDTWARTSYRDESGEVVVEANSGPQNVPHDVSGRGVWGDVVRFFELDQAPTPGTGGAGGMGGMGGMGGAGGVAGVAGSGGTAGNNTGGIAAGGAGAGAGGASGGTPATGGAGMGGGATAGSAPVAGSSAAGTAGSAGGGAGGASSGTGGMSSVAGAGLGGVAGTTTGPAGASNAGRGGTTSATAGRAGTSTKPDPSDPPADSGGCSIGATGDGTKGFALIALALGLLARRRRR
jgi:acetylxylan esterase